MSPQVTAYCPRCGAAVPFDVVVLNVTPESKCLRVRLYDAMPSHRCEDLRVRSS